MKKYFIILIIVIEISILCFSNDNKYINNKIGFSFKYSNYILILNDINEKNNWNYCITVDIYSFDDPTTIIFTRTTKDEYLKNFKNENEDFINPKNNKYNDNSGKYFKYNNETIGIIGFNSGGQHVTNYFYKDLIFIKNNYIIRISVYYKDKDYNIVKRYPKYFIYPYDMGTATWKDPITENCKEFYNLIAIKSKNAPQELIKLEEYFDEVIKSLELFDPKSIFYSPSVPNLRFRESPDLNGKFIRSLNQGEKLELIEKGKEETINNVKGTWVKVKTEKGEVGWCFDAYLEEVKKK